jgi:hypothetical protein
MPTPQACDGPCNRRYRDAEVRRETHGDANPYTPNQGRPYWCDTCADRLRQTLRGLPDLAARLVLEAVHGTPPPPEHVSGSREQPLHAGDGAYRLIDEICDLVTRFEDEWCAGAGLPPRPLRSRCGATITSSARFLVNELGPILAAGGQYAIELDDEARRLKRRVEHALHLDDVRPEPRHGVQCRQCDVMALEYQLDYLGRATGDTVCGNCGGVFTEDDMQAWIRMLAAYHCGSAA